MDEATSLLLVGISHRTATADLRGRLSGVKPMLIAGCRSGEPARPSIAETVIVSTCNRLEVYAAAIDPVRARADIESALCAASGGR